MSEKKAYPLRISADVLAAVQRWAEDDLRSVNSQIEFLLRDALRRNGRMAKHHQGVATSGGEGIETEDQVAGSATQGKHK